MDAFGQWSSLQKSIFSRTPRTGVAVTDGESRALALLASRAETRPLQAPRALSVMTCGILPVGGTIHFKRAGRLRGGATQRLGRSFEFREWGRKGPWSLYSIHGWIQVLLDLECGDRKSTRLNSSHQIISYAVF